MKNERQEEIKRLISECEIETQDELIEKLREQGFYATQATISRDIRQLKISKILGANGNYHYAFSSHESARLKSNPYIGSVVSVDHAQNLVVIKTLPGLAQAVAAGIDSVYAAEILGCVAGDDTIIAVARDEEVASAFCIKMRAVADRH